MFKVDDEDKKRVEKYNWIDNGNGYLYANINKKRIYMHHFILPKKDGLWTDHINGDRRDNRRSNLRRCTPHQNTINRKISVLPKSGYRGVWRFKDGRVKPWVSRIKHQGKHMIIGYFQTAEEAAVSYDKKSVELRGEFAVTDGLLERLKDGRS